jgi:hypothetical protein
MSLPSFDELKKLFQTKSQQFQGKSQQGYLQTLNEYEDWFKGLEKEAENRYSRAQIYGNIHLCFGLIATLSSTISLALTFYDNASVTAFLSLISAISAAIITFFNPSKREIKLLELKELCDLIRLKFISDRQVVADNKTSDLSKQVVLKSLGGNLEELTKRLNERI